MTEKAPMPLTLLDQDAATPLIQTYFELVQLKQQFREGWLQRGMDQSRTESVADHSFGNALLCLLLMDREPGLDVAKVLRMALLHDIGEAYVGDITPQDQVDPVAKKRMESEAVQTILGKFPGGDVFIELFHEYERQDCPEARFVKQIDRLELALQASVYEHQGLVDATEFIAAATKAVTNHSLLAELATLSSISGASQLSEENAGES